MKKQILFAAIAATSFIACSDDITKQYNNSNDQVTQEVDLEGTLQGCIYDGYTGARIGGKDLKVYLIQGTKQRKPSSLITDTNSVIKGEYAFSAIPVTSSEIISSTFKLVVDKPGYQQFESEFSFISDYDAKLLGSTLEELTGGNGSYLQGLTNTLQYESVMNKIGNVYLYPDSLTAQTIRVMPFAHGGFLAGVPVTLRRLSGFIDPGSVSSTVKTPSNDGSEGGNRDTRLYPSNGIYNVITKVTDENGYVEFTADELVLGASYRTTAGPAEVDGIKYVLTTGMTFNAGYTTGSGAQEIVMDEAVGDMPEVTIEDEDLNEANGNVVFTLNRPITLTTADIKGIKATVDDYDPTGDTLFIKSVAASVSSDGMTVSFVPTFNRKLVKAEPITITYSATTSNPLTYSTVNYTGSQEPIEFFSLETDDADWTWDFTTP